MLVAHKQTTLGRGQVISHSREIISGTKACRIRPDSSRTNKGIIIGVQIARLPYIFYSFARLPHKRNLFCLPRQKGFFLAFWAKIRRNQAISGFQAVDRPSGSPIFCYHDAKTVENAGVLFAFLSSVKNAKKIRVGRIWTPKHVKRCMKRTILSRPTLDFYAIICYNTKTSKIT